MVAHENTCAQIEPFIPGRRPEDLPDGGVKPDLRYVADGRGVNAADVAAALGRVGHTITPLEIVVVKTRAGSRQGSPDPVSCGCGMGREAAMSLPERGVRPTGTDAWRWDAPIVCAAKTNAETRDAGLIREGHKAGRNIGCGHLENLHKPEALPASGLVVSCFRHKRRGAAAGWPRAFAIFDDKLTAA